MLSQVTFSRFMAPEHKNASVRQGLFNRISRKSIDFLLCLPDFTVISAIELDDSSHSKARDDRRDAILDKAGIPVVRLHVREIPSVEEMKAIFTR